MTSSKCPLSRSEWIQYLQNRNIEMYTYYTSLESFRWNKLIFVVSFACLLLAGAISFKSLVGLSIGSYLIGALVLVYSLVIYREHRDLKKTLMTYLNATSKHDMAIEEIISKIMVGKLKDSDEIKQEWDSSLNKLMESGDYWKKQNE